ncbi:uncharacterized protein LOC117625601 [Prunus dulcis]|uniref:uncharacterized protein LOC117625601 n=1 Tax=Prunus dulcis TaxID=3755 RepID=UPI0014836740|nr:uncharacterized protein LOC117625601 [Prunus dulcis]
MKLTSLDIHRDISSAISTEIINTIIRDIGDSLFAILVDKSCDMSSKEYMEIVLCYVDKDTKSSSLKLAVDDFFSRHGLIISRLRGQGYDGASNMRVNVVGASAKRRDMLREKHADAIFEALNNNELLNVLKIVRTYGSGYEQKFEAKLRELNDRFNEKNTELLCMACLSPSNSFSAFDKAKLMRLAQFYPSDFPEHDIKLLENYIWDMSSNNKFTELKGITDLAQKMVETKKGSDLPFSVLASDTSVNPTCCDRKCRTSVFYYEYCEESVTQLNGGFVDE